MTIGRGEGLCQEPHHINPIDLLYNSAMREMHLAGFLIAGPVAHSHALWRHPETRFDFVGPEDYQTIARVLERGKFDLLFFADRLAMSSTYGQSLEMGVTYGDQDAVRLDPVPVLALMAAATTRIGLGATRSTTYYHPYHLARTFATLDHLTRGRAAWNVVTSVNQSEAQNFGYEEHLAHDRRYDRADEFMQVVYQLWESWEDGALLLDRVSGRFADADKVRPIDYEGTWFRSRGPLNVPRPPQGRPVIIQAGASGRGKAFAARWADVIFTLQPSAAQAQDFYRDVHDQMAAIGRDHAACTILLAVMPFVGESEALAKEQQALHNSLIHPLVGLSTLSSHMNYDFSQHPLDAPLADLPVQGMQGLFSAIRTFSDASGLTLRDVGELYGRSVLAPQIVGTASQIADQLEQLFLSQACDGFVISPSHLPGAFEAFVDQVVPELQQRGLFRHEYQGATLRDHLGLQRPAGSESR
jgi:FMN-dependent oxidoreductase (nitrilotriacetate monooxygenase family)